MGLYLSESVHRWAEKSTAISVQLCQCLCVCTTQGGDVCVCLSGIRRREGGNERAGEREWEAGEKKETERKRFER